MAEHDATDEHGRALIHRKVPEYLTEEESGNPETKHNTFETQRIGVNGGIPQRTLRAQSVTRKSD
ncbi:MAG TPA: hypothetical protein VJN64_06845 [Terriglobales bacterium]|nr:hypothetical protein [Terriglobales bacterium]